jgi:hypothetical protein
VILHVCIVMFFTLRNIDKVKKIKLSIIYEITLMMPLFANFGAEIKKIYTVHFNPKIRSLGISLKFRCKRNWDFD